MPTNKQRRDAQRRHLERQLQRRREREIRRRKTNLVLSIAGTLVLIAAVVVTVVLLSSGSDKKKPAAASKTPTTTTSTSPATSTSSSAAVAAYPCTWTKSGTPSKKATVPPTTTPPKTGTVTVDLKTTQGDLTLALNRAAAPCAVESFVSLASQKYFNDTPCHRLTNEVGLYVLQCGDPTGTGRGGPGYTFPDELSGNEKYTRGTLAMANGGPNTNGSQFFIVYKQSSLPASYTVFGSVTKGLDVVDKVAAKGSSPAHDGKPKLAIKLRTVTVAKS